MAIIQEKREDIIAPEVQETDYGATFVKASVETSSSEQKMEESVVVKRKGGRPRKSKK